MFEGTHHEAYSTAQDWEFDRTVLKSLPIYSLVGRLGARDVTLLNLSFFIRTLRLIMTTRGIVNEL